MRTPEFIATLQAIIYNDPSKAIRSRARDMGGLSFLSGRECMKIFGISHTRLKRSNFYHKPWRIRRKTALQNILTNSSFPSNRTPFGFSQMRKNSARIRWWIHRTIIDSQVILRVMETKHPVPIMMFWVVTNNGDFIFSFIFLHGLKLNLKAYIKCLEEIVLPWIKREAPRKLLYLETWLWAMLHKQVKPV